MKITVSHTHEGWRWNLTASNNKIIASGEAYQRPQKMIAAVNKYIVRDDPYLAEWLEYALYKNGLDATGKKLKEGEE